MSSPNQGNHVCLRDMSETLETFPNPFPQRDYVIRHNAPEFTSVCPKTGHPDFGEIILEYVPDQICVELKAYKIYLQGFRQKGIFYEAVTNEIFDTLYGVCKPRWMRIQSVWRPHGGISSTITVEEGKRPQA